MVIRDPVHGDILLSPEERRILDTPEMQRLRGIKQLGAAYLAYPGALHTRFDHCLGAVHTAQRILDGMFARGLPADPYLVRVIRAASLLHDVTHVPFGHTLEDERGIFARHDAGWRLDFLLAETDLGRTLRALGLGEAGELVRTRSGRGPRGFPRWAAEVVSGTVDADLLDYLRRDSYFAGLRHDYDDRVYSYFSREGEELCLDFLKDGMDRPDALSEVIQLLRTRYFLTERLYFHHTKVAAGAMIAKAVELALEEGLTERELIFLDDCGLLSRLRSFSSRVSRLVERFRRRALLKRGYVLPASEVSEAERQALVSRFREDGRARREAEEELARGFGVPPEEVIIYCPPLSWMKEAAVKVRTSRGVLPLNHPRVAPEELRLLEHHYRQLWRFYVFVPEEARSRCARAAAALVGHPGVCPHPSTPDPE